MQIELTPIVIVDGKVFKEHEMVEIKKLDDKSVNFFFKDLGFDLRIAPSQIIGGIPSIYYKNVQMDFGDYKIRELKLDNKPGVELYFKNFPIRRLVLIPRVMDDREYQRQSVKEQRSKYEKEHGFLFK